MESNRPWPAPDQHEADSGQQSLKSGISLEMTGLARDSFPESPVLRVPYLSRLIDHERGEISEEMVQKLPVRRKLTDLVQCLAHVVDPGIALDHANLEG